MLMYWTMFITPALFALGERSSPIVRRTSPFIIVYALFLLLVIGFRETGGDWPTYLIVYDRIDGSALIDVLLIYDPGYALLNWVSAELGTGIYGVNVVCGAIFLFGLYKFAVDEAKPILLVTIAIPYLVTVTAIGYTRQGVAIGIILYALTILRQYKPVRYFVLVLLASSFHLSAIIMLPGAYFGVQSTNLKYMNLLKALTVVSASYLVYLNSLESIDRFWELYVDLEHYVSTGAVIRSLMSGTAALVFFYYRRSWKQRWSDAPIWTVFSLLALAAIPMAVVESTAVDRMGLYLIPLQLVVFSRLPLLQRSQTTARVAVFGIVLVYTFVLGVWLYLGRHASLLWLPYKSLLFGVIP